MEEGYGEAPPDCSTRMSEQGKGGGQSGNEGQRGSRRARKARRERKGRRHLLTAEPFIDKVVLLWARRLQLDANKRISMLLHTHTSWLFVYRLTARRHHCSQCTAQQLHRWGRTHAVHTLRCSHQPPLSSTLFTWTCWHDSVMAGKGHLWLKKSQELLHLLWDQFAEESTR